MKYPEIKTINIKNIPTLEVLNSNLNANCIADLNTLLSFVDCPLIRGCDQDVELISDIATILKHLENELGYDTTYATDQLLTKAQLIRAYHENEQECDRLEIELANLKVEYDEIQEYSKYDIQELEHIFSKLNDDFNDLQFENTHKILLDQVYSFLYEEPVSRNILNAFYYLKQLDLYNKVIEKDYLVNVISSDQKDSQNPHGNVNCNNILYYIANRIVNNEYANIPDLAQELQVDKILILKIVYSLVNNDIVTFDKKNETVSLIK